MRGRTQEENTKLLQDLDLIDFPHLEKILIGGNVELNLLSLFPQEYARIMGGIKRKGKLFKVNNGGERVGRTHRQMGKKGSFIGPSRKLAVAATYDRSLRRVHIGVSGCTGYSSLNRAESPA